MLVELFFRSQNCPQHPGALIHETFPGDLGWGLAPPTAGRPPITTVPPRRTLEQVGEALDVHDRNDPRPRRYPNQYEPDLGPEDGRLEEHRKATGLHGQAESG